MFSDVDKQRRSVHVQHVLELDSIIHEVHSVCANLPTQVRRAAVRRPGSSPTEEEEWRRSDHAHQAWRSLPSAAPRRCSRNTPSPRRRAEPRGRCFRYVTHPVRSFHIQVELWLWNGRSVWRSRCKNRQLMCLQNRNTCVCSQLQYTNTSNESTTSQ